MDPGQTSTHPVFDGLVSIETFNKANQGKIAIMEEDGDLKMRQTNVRQFIKRL